MSKKQFKSQASSGRAAFGAGASFGGSFGTSAFGSSSPLSWIAEPPDLSAISDPNVAVSFKNLTKKDSTTKAKALEDLLVYVSPADQQVEEAVLEAWVKLYPRLSIDSARRVRQLAHTLLGEISLKCGKRIAKHMPKIAGPWLAGANDSDRAAAKAAQASLEKVFNSPEKLQNVGRAFQKPILEYCRNAILDESVQTLSDERAVSPDDAEATYSRVIATSVAVISNLLGDLSPEETSKLQDTYEAVIGESKIWDFAAYKDVVVRGHVHRLLSACLVKQKSSVEANLHVISKAYIDKALISDQTGSSFYLMQALVDLTDIFPQAWTSSYKGKKASSERLRQGLKKGSQLGSALVWTRIWTLFTKLPKEVLPNESAEVKKFLGSLHQGVSQRDERFNAASAWETYFRIVDLLLANSSLSEEDRNSLIQELVLPAVGQYLRPSQETSEWAVFGAKAPVIISKIALIKHVAQQLEHKWPDYTAGLLEEMKISSPEQSKDFEKSQTAVAQAGERWALLQSAFISEGHQSDTLPEDHKLPTSLLDTFQSSTESVVQGALDLLRARNGKPYGAAAVIDGLMNYCNESVFGDQNTANMVSTFVLEDLPQLLDSPSQRHLFSILYHYQTQPKFPEAWNNVAASLGNSPDSAEKLAAFRSFLASPRVKPAANLAAQNSEIQAFIQRQYSSSISTGEQWSFIAGVLRTAPSVAAPDTGDAILADLTASLSISDKAVSALQGLEEISAGNQAIVKAFIGNPDGGQLLPNLLHLQDSPDESIALKASTVSKRIVDDADKSSSQAILFDVVHQSLNNVSADSLPILSVVEMASKLISGSDSEQQRADIAKQALPNLDIWTHALACFLNSSPPPSQAITSLVGGAVYLVHQSRNSYDNQIARDAEGISQALRFVIYVLRVFSDASLLEALDSESQTTLFKLFTLTYTLMQDGVNLRGPLGLVSAPDSDLEVPISKFQSEAGHLSSDCFFKYVDASSVEYGFVGSMIDSLLVDSKSASPTSFYSAEALSLSLAELHSAHGNSHGKVLEYEDRALRLYKAREVIPFTACAVGLNEALVSSKKLDRQANELVADLTGLSMESPPEKALSLLVMLNALLTNRDVAGLVAKQRLIFLMKHVLPWLEEPELLTTIKSETCSLLCSLLPAISDMYGEHWSEVLTVVVSAWSRGFADVETETLDHSGMVLVHNSLRLYGVLRSLTTVEDPNDDLVDAWKEHENSACRGLVSLLVASNGVPDMDYLPLNATFELLAKELALSQKAAVDDAEALYPLLYAESRPLQRTSFNILHTYIPSLQEQISFDAALENKTAQLPEELLSLVLEAPSLDSTEFASPKEEIPRDLQGYLYSWQLVFDHFSNASYKVKSDYIDSLNKGDYLPLLLNLTYELLGHTRGKPVDVSKYNIVSYDWSEQTGDDSSDSKLTPDKRIQWLLSHLFYQCLSHLPSLTKSHYLGIKARQTSLAVESWTAKYISPLIINTSLNSVVEWSSSSSNDNNDADFENLTVKVSMRSREVNVGYLVDEQTMAIVVRLPEAYPLAGAKVEGVNRVGVDEKKWQSWLRNCQGVITFSNGNLVDGLSTWRKNVAGALKGQTECAICYSIISGDKQLPSKRCSTCKNLFHSSCLFKWFKTSNASTCPLCRNPFNYG